MHLLVSLLLIAISFPNLAKETNDNPTDYLNPTPYKSLADVPKQYHDGQRLTGCYIFDYVLTKDDDHPYTKCRNPYYWDEHGNLRNIFDPHLPSRALFPQNDYGLPETYKPAPCEGCLNEEQAIDIMRVYHQLLGIEPLGYRGIILKDFPWNGDVSITYNECVTDYPYPDLALYQRVNLPRKMRPFTGEGELRNQCKDSGNRDLTWMIQFQIGWIEEGHYRYHEDYPAKDIRLGKKSLGLLLRGAGGYHENYPTKNIRYPKPCIATHYIHAETGWIIGSGYRDRETSEFTTGSPGEFYFGDPEHDIFGYGFNPYSTTPFITAERCSEGAEIDYYHDLVYSSSFSTAARISKKRFRVAYLYAHELLFQYLPDSPRRKQLELIFEEFRKNLSEPPKKNMYIPDF